jgi:hypothetical protein
MSHLPVVVAVVNGEWTFVSVDGGRRLMLMVEMVLVIKNGERER